jgi:hypothetical protein
MQPKELQDNVMDECAVKWDATSESEAESLCLNIKGSIKHTAKSRSDMSGPNVLETEEGIRITVFVDSD